jgi:hypothetical protein
MRPLAFFSAVRLGVGSIRPAFGHLKLQAPINIGVHVPLEQQSGRLMPACCVERVFQGMATMQLTVRTQPRIMVAMIRTML